MCGIAGYFSFGNEIDKKKFEQMVDIVAYRGPDDRGVFYEDSLGLGHRRLSIIDLSDEGHQPFIYEERYVVVYNGEIYNYIEIRKELISKGYCFKTKTDTEVLIAAYDCYGRECINKFNGMWAFAIYDREKREIFCCRDRFGIKPFYYYFDGNTFIFGSEIKQLLVMLPQKIKVNEKVLLDYLICGDQDYNDDTFFMGINKLQHGHELILHITKPDNPLEIKQYYDLGKKKESTISYGDAKKKFRKKIEESVRFRLRADVPIGYCLSGGLDSSAIVAIANDLVRKEGENVDQHSVSSCFADKEYDEQEYIDEVVEKTKLVSHKVFPTLEGMWGEFDKVIWHMDEPFASSSVFAQWSVFKEAANHGLTVMLDGQGSDEQLAGYTSFYGVRFSSLIKKCKFVSLIREFRDYVQIRASTEPWINYKEILLIALVSAIVPRKISNRIRCHYGSDAKLPFSREQKKRVFYKRTVYPVNNTRKFILDSMGCGLQALLHYEDRNSMAFSIESRVPFLDYQLVEAVFEMPYHCKINKGRTKAVLRDGLRDILPEKIFNRYSKLGFVTPEDKWINTNQDMFKEELRKACKALTPILDEKQVMNWFERDGRNAQRGNEVLFRIICAGRWVKLFNVDLTS